MRCRLHLPAFTALLLIKVCPALSQDIIFKPTGQGTGLGLSLSYDIVKAHGGEIKVETKEGEESEFVIQLPGS